MSLTALIKAALADSYGDTIADADADPIPVIVRSKNMYGITWDTHLIGLIHAEKLRRGEVA